MADAFDVDLAHLDAVADRALREQIQRVVDYARASHVFQTRTGTLEGSIEARVSGSLSAGTLEGEVDATADYADAVVAKTNDDFIANAVEALESAVEDALAEAIGDALGAD